MCGTGNGFLKASCSDIFALHGPLGPFNRVFLFAQLREPIASLLPHLAAAVGLHLDAGACTAMPLKRTSALWTYSCPSLPPSYIVGIVTSENMEHASDPLTFLDALILTFSLLSGSNQRQIDAVWNTAYSCSILSGLGYMAVGRVPPPIPSSWVFDLRGIFASSSSLSIGDGVLLRISTEITGAARKDFSCFPPPKAYKAGNGPLKLLRNATPVTSGSADPLDSVSRSSQLLELLFSLCPNLETQLCSLWKAEACFAAPPWLLVPLGLTTVPVSWTLVPLETISLSTLLPLRMFSLSSAAPPALPNALLVLPNFGRSPLTSKVWCQQ